MKSSGHSECGTFRPKLQRMDVEAVIAALGDHYDADEATIAERMLREYVGTVPEKQLIEEIGLAVAIHRRGRG